VGAAPTTQACVGTNRYYFSVIRNEPDVTNREAGNFKLTADGGFHVEHARVERPGSTEDVELDSKRPVAVLPDAEFRALYDTNFRLVWSALSRLGVRDADLMDQTQKVFLTAYLKLPGFERRSEISTWLWGICRRIAIAYRRSSAIRCEIVTDPENLEFLTTRPGGFTNDSESPRQALAEKILSKLSEPQRVAFLLLEVDEMNGREVATFLNIPLGTVRSRLRNARKLFRREVQRLSLAGVFNKRDRNESSPSGHRTHSNSGKIRSTGELLRT
jgi:RNA polymerase sigma-70 factor (ECF subfamily)